MVLQIKSHNESASNNVPSSIFRLYVLIGYEKKYLSFTECREEILKHELSVVELTNVTIGIETEEEVSVNISWGQIPYHNGGTEEHSCYTLDVQQREIALFENGNGKEYPWRCGVYPIKVSWNGRTFWGCYRIIPKNLDPLQMDMIHEQLNYQLQGLIVDYLDKRQFVSSANPLHASPLWKYTHWFLEKQKEIFSSIRSMMHQPHIEIGKQYEEESFPKRLDYRSARFENTLKGSVKRGERHYNRSLVKSIDNDQNRLVKIRLLKWLNELKEAVNELSQKVTVNNLALVQREDDYLNYEQRYENLLLDSRTPELHLVTRRNALQTKHHELENLKKQVEEQAETLENTQLLMRQLTAYLSHSFWLQVKVDMPQRLLYGKHPSYQMFAKLWHESRSHFNYTYNNQNVFVPVYHPSYLLYEYYVLFGAIRAISELGFLTEDDIGAMLSSALTHSGIPEGFTIRLDKGTERIEVVYNQTIELKAREALMNHTHFYLNHNHRKPDIRLDYYQDIGGQWRFQQSIILEVKYSPLKNIMNPQTYGDTRATKQMDAYGNIKYIYSEHEYNHRAIHSVICVYPGDVHSPVYFPFEYGYLLQFYPSVSEDKIIGFEELKKEIHQMILENV